MTRRILFAAALAPVLRAEFKGARLKSRRASRSRKGADGRSAAAEIVEFEVSAEERFPVRALDPVLYIGKLEVRDYRYANIENTVLVFTCAEPERLEDAVPARLEYEGDPRTRTDLGLFRLNSVQ